MKRSFKKYLPIFVFSLLLTCHGNELISFEESEDEGFLRMPSISQMQTGSTLLTQTKKRRPQQTSLLRQANIKRNGFYVMFAANVIPIQRLLNNTPHYVFSTGAGIRTGVVSYLDTNIGVRGYFAFDFTNDNLTFINSKNNPYNGTLVMASLGLDILLDFFVGKNYKHTLGFFAGIGAGAFIYFDLKTPIITQNTQSNYNFGANVMVQGGISAVFSYYHRLEIGCKFLPSQSLDVNIDGVIADYNPYVAYSYKF